MASNIGESLDETVSRKGRRRPVTSDNVIIRNTRCADQRLSLIGLRAHVVNDVGGQHPYELRVRGRFAHDGSIFDDARLHMTVLGEYEFQLEVPRTCFLESDVEYDTNDPANNFHNSAHRRRR